MNITSRIKGSEATAIAPSPLAYIVLHESSQSSAVSWEEVCMSNLDWMEEVKAMEVNT